ncbi:transcriptional regulator [Rhodococcus sp. 14-2686-1-2]|nr:MULTISPECIES: helix-turn-helix domain-containing protein [unclassified Rhodococcus (in: high G+C Gram-positive bacteria)]OZE93191.1 transcriptional regulator [Rhodococcus sp. 15-1189-1-1a]OZF08309.1 transcriptional regulator [Rhodococcus sp. 14-2686-1-2]
MRWLDVDTTNCSVQAAVDVVGQKWSLLIIRELFNGVHRFDEIQQHIGISEAVLARRLRELIHADLVESREYRDPGQRARREYRLSAPGLDLFPIVIALLNWGDKHRAPSTGGSWQVRHHDCGEQVTAVVTCPSHPGTPLDHRHTVTNAGPDAVAAARE